MKRRIGNLKFKEQAARRAVVAGQAIYHPLHTDIRPLRLKPGKTVHDEVHIQQIYLNIKTIIANKEYTLLLRDKRFRVMGVLIVLLLFTALLGGFAAYHSLNKEWEMATRNGIMRESTLVSVTNAKGISANEMAELYLQMV